jgi:predicted tellurium resistance membrane protein TerC
LRLAIRKESFVLSNCRVFNSIDGFLLGLFVTVIVVDGVLVVDNLFLLYFTTF